MSDTPTGHLSGWLIRLRLLALLIGTALLLAACGSPGTRLLGVAEEKGFQRALVRAGGFDVTVFSNPARAAQALTDASAVSPDSTRQPLHVYLEGDGSPWRYRVIVMPDPTPRQPLMLHLMALDPSPAVYIGRPCYNGTATDDECNSNLWTFGRYSSSVVDSMAAAVRNEARRHRTDEVWLFGHSGGGALAMLLAARLQNVTRVVTVAGNLDTDAWTGHHGLTPLYSSLNPARQPALASRVQQWHLLGELDSVIPPAIVTPFILAQPSADAFRFPGYRHGCCWARVWPTVLRSLELDDPAGMPGIRFKQASPPAVDPESL